MITGIVTASRQATVRLPVRGREKQEQEIQAVIDTGFDGSLTLPPSVISILGLPWRRHGRAMLADGSETLFDIHEGTVMWNGELRRIAVDAAATDPLVGMLLLYGYELTVKVVEGGSVLVRGLP